MMIEPTVLAYIAGLFDGEGCVIPGYRKGKKKNQNGSFLAIQIANTNKPAMEYIKNVFGGALNPAHERPEWKVRWHLTLQANQAVYFLNNILPYLRIKNKQAELGIELQKLIRSEKKGKPKFLTPEEIDSRRAIIEQIRVLNKKGNPDYIKS